MSADAAPLEKRSWRGRLLSPGFARTLVAVAAVALCAVQVPLAVHVHGISVLAALVLAVAHASCAPLALWFARQAAVLSIAASTLLMLTVVGSGDGVWPWGVVPLITQVLVVGVLGFAASGTVTALTLTGSLASSVVVSVAATDTRTLSDSWSNVMLFAGLAVMAAALGAVLRQAADIGVDLHRQREISADEHARRLVVEEKSRVARELHDVIAHNMSLITVQARSAPHRLPGLGPEVSDELGQIADLAADALAQMRGVLTVLRTEEGQSGLRPAPSLRQVPELVEAVRNAGQDVAFTWAVPDDLDLSADVGTSAYRIVQEALSNARRHAPESAAELAVVVEDGALVVRVDNAVPAGPSGPGGPAGPAGAPTAPIPGHGLVGMRERASAVGGHVELTGSPGAFGVRALLPLRRAGRPGRPVRP